MVFHTILKTEISLAFCIGYLFACLLVGPGCGGSDEYEDDAMSIGVLLPFTGSVASLGFNHEKSLSFAAERINQTGLLDKPIKLVFRDTKSTIAGGITAAQKLFDESDLLAVIGPNQPNVGFAVADVINKESDLFNLIVFSFPVPSGLDLGHNAIHLGSSLEAMSCQMASRLYKDRVKGLMIIYEEKDDNKTFATFATSLRDDFVEISASTGDNVFVRNIDDSENSPIAETTTLHPDAVVLVTYTTTAADIVHAATALGYTGKWYFSVNHKNKYLLENVPPGSIEGMVGISPSLPNSAYYFEKDFALRWDGELPTVSSYYHFDALVLFALAIKAAGIDTGASPSREIFHQSMSDVSSPPGDHYSWDELEDVLHAIEQGDTVNYRGVSGPLDLDETGMNLVGTGYFDFWKIEETDFRFAGYGNCPL